jgi:hypothetical protein
MTSTRSFFGAAGAAGMLLLTGCGSDWTVQNAKFFAYSNQDVRVSAKFIMNRKAKPIKDSNGVELHVRFYTAAYGAEIAEKQLEVGGDLESSNETGKPEVVTLAAPDVRLGGTPSNSYADLCADFKLDNSNTLDWVQLGCIHYTDPPTNDPTGGVENMLVGEG